MSKYDALDFELLRRIRNNPGLAFFQINVAEVAAEARNLDPTDMEPWRAVDKRLQALRRKKLIKYRTKTPHASQGWYAIVSARGKE